jgi:hypothetical protein
VVREALLKLRLIRNIRQFMALGNNLEDAMRKAATLAGENHYDKTAIAPVVSWATNAQVLDLNVRIEKLVDEAVATKETRTPRKSRLASRLSHTARTISRSSAGWPVISSRAALRSGSTNREYSWRFNS